MYYGSSTGSNGGGVRPGGDGQGAATTFGENEGGGIKRAADVKYPTFLGALLDVLPGCVDRKDKNGEIGKGIYSDKLTEVIGAFDEAGTPSSYMRPRWGHTPRRCKRHGT